MKTDPTDPDLALLRLCLNALDSVAQAIGTGCPAWYSLRAKLRDRLAPQNRPINFVRLETSTTRYKAEDGQERAVLLWKDYEALLRAARGPISPVTGLPDK